MTENSEHGKIRVKERDKKLLSPLRKHPEIREKALEEGVTDNIRGETLTWESLMKLVIPDDAEVMSRPEDEMSWIRSGEAKSEVTDLAGENIAVHEVVSKHTEQFIEEQSIEV
jgi:hypothetical protein